MKEVSDSHPKNQHYVPKVLLKNFSSINSHIWVYDKYAMEQNWTIIKERPITKVASEDYFYDKIKSSKEGSYEYELGKTEKAVNPIFSKIIAEESIDNISSEEKQILALFIAQQMIRTKEQLEYFRDESKKMLQMFKQFGATEKDFDYKELWFEMLKSTDAFSEILFKKVWCLGKSDGSAHFYLSDHPVAKQNTTDISEIRGTTGLDSYGIEIYLPINSNLVLCLFCEKLFLNYNSKIPVIPFTFENILNINAIQFYNSTRFIFSSTNNFEMIEKEIKK